jgi:hypothetical protein
MVYVDYRVFIFFASAQVASIGCMCCMKCDCSISCIAVVCVTVTVVTSH